MALFIVVLLNINSYAAVGANDGSAFVTKAEFDALVNTFNDQMDGYQAGLNSKIDGAIANYLAGLSAESRVTKDIFNNSWSILSCINGTYAPSFWKPDLDILYGGNYRGNFSYTSGSTKEFKQYTMGYAVRYTYNLANKMTRAIATCNKSEADQSASGVKYYWGGVTKEYTEKYSINAGLSNNGNSDLYGIEGTGAKSLTFENGVTLNINDGYQSSFPTLTSVVSPTISYKYDGAHPSTLTFNTKTVGCTAEVTTGETIDYLDHIIQYDGEEAWCLSVPNFTHTFRTHEDNTHNSSNILSSTSKAAEGSVTCLKGTGSSGPTTPSGGASTTLTFSHSTTTSKTFPSIGMLKYDKQSKNITQFKDPVYWEASTSTKGTVTDLRLVRGMMLLAAPKDATIKWSPRFTKGKVYDSTNKKWVDSSVTRVKLFFSLATFSNKLVSTDLVQATSDVGTTVDGGVLCNVCINSSDKATEVTFKMPKDGLVYAKWVPDTSDYDTAKWIQPVDVSQSSTYTQITE